MERLRWNFGDSWSHVNEEEMVLSPYSTLRIASSIGIITHPSIITKAGQGNVRRTFWDVNLQLGRAWKCPV